MFIFPMRFILEVSPDFAETFAETYFLPEGVATRAFLIFTGLIHFYFNERQSVVSREVFIAA